MQDLNKNKNFQIDHRLLLSIPDHQSKVNDYS